MTNAAKKESAYDLQRMCESIADDIRKGVVDGFQPDEEGQEPSAYDYLSDALDIEYIVDRKGEYLGARVLVAFGGPNIWINTRTKTIEGAWWSDRAFVPFYDGLGLDDALEELWSCR